MANKRECAVPESADLEGLVCLVIGGGNAAQNASLSIGTALSVGYARSGGRVVVGDISGEAAQSTIDELEADNRSGTALIVDSRSPESIRHAIDATLQQFGRLDVLHYNVGIGKAGKSEQTSAEDWNRIAETNLTGFHVASQAAIPAMASQKSGVILATSTIASRRFVGFPHLAYGATKAAVNHYCRMIAMEHASAGIRANAIIVGLVDTPRIRSTVMTSYGDEAAMIAKRNAQIPLGFMGDGWDVANAAVFLASKRARYISGTTLTLDGALTATVQH